MVTRPLPSTGAGADTLPSADGPVAAALDHLAAVRPAWLKSVFAYSPILIGLILLADVVLINGQFIMRDPLRLTSLITILITFILFQALFRKVPLTLRALWDRGLISSPSDVPAQTAQSFAGFVGELDRLVNSRTAWIAAALFAAIGLLGTYKVRAWFEYCAGPQQFERYANFCVTNYRLDALAHNYLWGNAAVVAPLLMGLLGLAAWRLMAIALYTYRLSARFTLNVQFRHPDGRGGLKPFGDLCLLEASLLFVPALFFAFWGVAISAPPIRQLLALAPDNLYQILWSGFYRNLLMIVLNAAAIWVFCGPVYRVHRQMARRRDELQARVDALSGRAAVHTGDPLDRAGVSLPRDLTQLRETIAEAFDASELATLCFDLGVDYENLDAVGKDDKARELVAYMNRAGRLGELVQACRRQRPSAAWPDLTTPTAGPNQPEKLEDLAETYRAVENVPIWPLDRSALLIAVAAQAVLVASLVASVAVSS